jgi:hypothetical protein
MFGTMSFPGYANDADEHAAVAASGAWLSLVDKGQYRDSWNAAADVLKTAVRRGTFEAQLKAARGPLGKFVSRKLKNKQYMTSLPGAPDGKYVVIQYETAFANKQSALETVTPMLDKNGHWKVSGYYIR